MMMMTATTGTITTGVGTTGTTGTTGADMMRDMMRGTLTGGSEDEVELAMITVGGEM